jgi:hypothetical protein
MIFFPVEVESFLGFESFFLKIPKINFHMNYLRGNIYIKKRPGQQPKKNDLNVLIHLNHFV